MTDTVLILLPETKLHRLQYMVRQAETAEHITVMDIYQLNMCWLRRTFYTLTLGKLRGWFIDVWESSLASSPSIKGVRECFLVMLKGRINKEFPLQPLRYAIFAADLHILKQSATAASQITSSLGKSDCGYVNISWSITSHLRVVRCSCGEMAPSSVHKVILIVTNCFNQTALPQLSIIN